MNISITFRHMASSEAIKQHAEDKISKLQRFLRQPMTAKVTLSIDGLNQIAEAQISSGGEHLEAKESSEDVYASIDRMTNKLERQIRRDKGTAQAKRKGAESVRSVRLSAAVAPRVASAKTGARAKPAKKAGRAKAPAKKRTR